LKVVEWLDLQENIEVDSLFPILRLKPAADRSSFRGNDEKWESVETRILKKSSETIYPTL